jgi:hypothetical protein
MDASRITANLPTPWLGVWERINIFGYMLWIVVLSINLLRVQTDGLELRDKKTNIHSEIATNRI